MTRVARSLPPALLGLALLGLGCAHSPSAKAPAPFAPAEAEEKPVAALPFVPRPQDQSTARHLLESAFEAAAEDDNARAAALFHAVLSSDFLTDKGRANIYWVTAGVHRRLGDSEGEADALGAFLLAAGLVGDDPTLETRRLLARSLLAARRVRTHPHIGRSPEAAIPVEDAREPASIIGSLSCGPSGKGRYIDVAIERVESDDGSLVHRRAKCGPTGGTLELWFDLTYAD